MQTEAAKKKGLHEASTRRCTTRRTTTPGATRRGLLSAVKLRHIVTGVTRRNTTVCGQCAHTHAPEYSLWTLCIECCVPSGRQHDSSCSRLSLPSGASGGRHVRCDNSGRCVVLPTALSWRCLQRLVRTRRHDLHALAHVACPATLSVIPGGRPSAYATIQHLPSRGGDCHSPTPIPHLREVGVV